MKCCIFVKLALARIVGATPSTGCKTLQGNGDVCNIASCERPKDEGVAHKASEKVQELYGQCKEL